MEILAQRIKTLRQEQEIKQIDAAKALHLSISAYCRYEYGEREPMAPFIVAFANYFCVSTDYLLGVKDER